MNTIDFIPFGAQYYRAPTPLREDFRHDLETFAGYGFNTIKIWLQWRWNNPAEGEYDFSDMKELLDLSQEFGLKVIINIICDAAPAWFFKKYPDAMMRYADGRPMMPQVLAFRQIGGAPGPCFHHPEGIAYRRQFIQAAVKELGDHPALMCWDLWNEPELTCGIKRPASEDGMVCYCDNTRREFIQWLQARYGTIEGVNYAWGRNYRSFEELELPIHCATFQDMVDWRRFFADTMAGEMKMRAAAVRSVNTSRPVMAHTVPMPYFNMVNACSDEYLLAQDLDMFGNSLGSFPFSATTATSAAKGKRVFNAEIHAIGGDTFNRPGIPSFDETKRHIFVPMGRGVTGFLFWQYKPERLGFEAPAWGMTDFKCRMTPQLDYAQRINKAIRTNEQALLRTRPVAARIAVVNSGEGQVFNWCVSGAIDRQFYSVQGIFDMLYEAGYAVDIISEHQVTDEGLKDYACVIWPFPYYMRKVQSDALRRYVENGGFLISEALFGSYIAECNLHSTEYPGYGFTEVFGVEEESVLAAHHFQNAYGANWSQGNAEDEMPITYEGGIAKGYFYRQSFICHTAQPVAYFKDGVAAAVNNYGKGQAAIIGSLLGFTYARSKDKETAGLLLMLLDKYSDVRPMSSGCKHADFLLEGDIATFMTVQTKADAADPTVTSDYLADATKVINIVDGREYAVEKGTVKVEVLADGIEAFRICRD